MAGVGLGIVVLFGVFAFGMKAGSWLTWQSAERLTASLVEDALEKRRLEEERDLADEEEGAEDEVEGAEAEAGKDGKES